MKVTIEIDVVDNGYVVEHTTENEGIKVVKAVFLRSEHVIDAVRQHLSRTLVD